MLLWRNKFLLKYFLNGNGQLTITNKMQITIKEKSFKGNELLTQTIYSGYFGRKRSLDTESYKVNLLMSPSKKIIWMSRHLNASTDFQMHLLNCSELLKISGKILLPFVALISPCPLFSRTFMILLINNMTDNYKDK